MTRRWHDPTTLIGGRQLLEDDPRVQRILAELEATIEKATAEATARAEREFDTLEGSERLRPYAAAIAAEVRTHPETYDATTALRVLREAAGRTLTSIGQATGRSRKTVARWERTPATGGRLYLSEVRAYCAALDVDATALMMLVDRIHEQRSAAVPA